MANGGKGTTIQTFTTGLNSRSIRAAQCEREDDLKKSVAKLAQSILMNTSTSREQSLALTKLEELFFWATAAIAREPVTNGVDVLAERKTLFGKLCGLMTGPGPVKKKVPALSVAEKNRIEMWLGLAPFVDEIEELD